VVSTTEQFFRALVGGLCTLYSSTPLRSYLPSREWSHWPGHSWAAAGGSHRRLNSEPTNTHGSFVCRGISLVTAGSLESAEELEAVVGPELSQLLIDHREVAQQVQYDGQAILAPSTLSICRYLRQVRVCVHVDCFFPRGPSKGPSPHRGPGSDRACARTVQSQPSSLRGHTDDRGGARVWAGSRVYVSESTATLAPHSSTFDLQHGDRRRTLRRQISGGGLRCGRGIASTSTHTHFLSLTHTHGPRHGLFVGPHVDALGMSSCLTQKEARKRCVSLESSCCVQHRSC
jgi:hypothetical protein